MPDPYDAFLLLSFGGPEKHADVIPFLENVLRGRSVPRERMLEVAGHYYHFDGRSPINDQNRDLLAALSREFTARGVNLPVYWGNRNSHPLLADTLGEMKNDGVKRALCFVTSAFSSYSGCRQYLEDIARARAEVGEGAPEVEKLRGFHNHPGFIETMTVRVREALASAPDASPHVLFTAHSIPAGMSAGSPYVRQLQESCRLVAESVGVSEWKLAYQSRSGPPSQPWLEPDVLDEIRHIGAAGVGSVVVVPIGFVSDHMEVLYDLDTEAAAVAQDAGVRLIRAGTAGSHPRFVSMIVELVLERMRGEHPANQCPEGCCPAPTRIRA